ncbi:tagatose 6-phosphate kinase [Saccharopolyspora antimicrobica]|uniref:Tagatose 6-phosphate kinase n=1 Tax=Saccharopolyspora antimicrobica TaxID=455193 RepID=A0A1I5CA05_9PSEU|nr:1-phosphofructokinase family hexose kinase [Saccharopolyspora antimicrobica]RKT88924.1 tagatose 6-phosphate kinase [Saccharopolyspora antimicrobica]SFN83716.1 tagatose 6-phosphate kinase [Saccharopolyspora antimicrobica]
MIITVTPNPALDVSYRVAHLSPGASHRVRDVHERAGGKGLNVSRVLHGQGIGTLVAAPVGGVHGDAIREDLDAAGIEHLLLPVPGPTRRTIAVVAEEDTSGEATLFNEPGSHLGEADWQRFRDLLATRLPGASVLVCSGSLPPGCGADSYAELVRDARSRSVPAIVDATGPALLAAAEAGADLVKPNAVELRETTGQADPATGARQLRERGAAAVIVSLGPDGLLAVTDEGSWCAAPPFAVSGNPTGAGDAAVAAFAAGIAGRQNWPERLRNAVAWSAAAAAAPVAGALDDGVLREISDHIAIEPV